MRGTRGLPNRAAAAVALILAFGATAAAFEPTDGLAAYFQFEEGLGLETWDSSPSGFVGQLTGEVNWGIGMFGAGLDFAGTDGHVVIQGLGPIQTAPEGFSIAAWVLPFGGADPQSVVAKSWNRMYYASDCFSVAYRVEDTAPNLHIASAPPGLVPPGVWSHVGFSVDHAASLLTVYVNGMPVAQESWSGESYAGNVGHDDMEPWTLGSRSGTDEFLAGALDEVRFYGRVLNEIEFMELFDCAPGPEMPAVSIIAVDPVAREAWPEADIGQLILFVEGGMDFLTVNLLIEGSATRMGPEGDYEIFANGVPIFGDFVDVFPGEEMVFIDVVPIDDDVFGEGEEDVVITIGPGPYEIGPDSVATVTIMDNDTEPPGAFDLVSPTEGADVEVDSPVSFSWTGSAYAHEYRLELSPDEGVSWPIQRFVPGFATSFELEPLALSEGEAYLWRVAAVNFVGETTSASTRTVNAVDTAPEVASTSPADGSIDAPTDAPIEITFTQALDPATVTDTCVTVDGGAVTGTVFPAAANVVLFIPDSNLGYQTTYSVTVAETIADLGGNTLEVGGVPGPCTFSFTTWEDLTGLPPVPFALVGPADGATGLPRTATLEWEVSRNAEGYTLTIATDASLTDVVLVQTDLVGSVRTVPPGVLDHEATYYWRVTAHNADGDTSCDTDFSFTTAPDTIPPWIMATSPHENDMMVPLSADVTVTFSEPMDAAETVGAVVVRREDGTTVQGEAWLSSEGLTLTFAPVAEFDYLTAYTVTVRAGAADLAGNRLPADFDFTFTTEHDAAGPEIVSTDPADGTGGVSVGCSITITFSEPMDPASLYGAVTVTDGTSTAACTTGVSADGTRLTLTPEGELQYETTYVVTVSTAAMDAFLNPLAAAHEFTFTTAVEPGGVEGGAGGIGCVPGAGGTASLAALAAILAMVRRCCGRTTCDAGRGSVCSSTGFRRAIVA